MRKSTSSSDAFSLCELSQHQKRRACGCLGQSAGSEHARKLEKTNGFYATTSCGQSLFWFWPPHVLNRGPHPRLRVAVEVVGQHHWRGVFLWWPMELVFHSCSLLRPFPRCCFPSLLIFPHSPLPHRGLRSLSLLHRGLRSPPALSFFRFFPSFAALQRAVVWTHCAFSP